MKTTVSFSLDIEKVEWLKEIAERGYSGNLSGALSFLMDQAMEEGWSPKAQKLAAVNKRLDELRKIAAEVDLVIEARPTQVV